MSDGNAQVGTTEPANQTAGQSNPVNNTTQADPGVDQAELETLRAELKNVRKEAAGYRIKNKELTESLEAANTTIAGHTTEITNLKTSIKTNTIKTEFGKLAQEAGALDTDAAFKLVDQSKFEFDGDNVKAESLKAAIEELKKAHPFVFRSGANSNIDAGKTGDQPQTGSFTDYLRTQIQR